jgi:EAL domain-containing protein (putative c-di-GMP-specific phosphodiesterase class I)
MSSNSCFAKVTELKIGVLAFRPIEITKQCNLLFNKGCNYYRGYLFGKPLPIEVFESELANFPSRQKFSQESSGK